MYRDILHEANMQKPPTMSRGRAEGHEYNTGPNVCAPPGGEQAGQDRVATRVGVAFRGGPVSSEGQDRSIEDPRSPEEARDLLKAIGLGCRHWEILG